MGISYELYNKDVKANFLNLYTENKYRTNLKRLSYYESYYCKDFFCFTPDEIYYTLGNGFECKTKRSLRDIRTVLTAYLEWCIKTGYVNKLVDLDEIFNYLEVKNTVNINAQELQYVSEEQVKEICKMLLNPQDAILFSLLFVGVNGVFYDELINLEVKDFNYKTNTLTIKGETNPCKKRQIIVPNWVVEIVQKAEAQTVYYKNNGYINSKTITPTTEIIQTNYIVRNVRYIKNIDSETKVKFQCISKRIQKICGILHIPFVTPKSIHRSGIFHSLKEIEKERPLTIDDYKNIRSKFGLNPLDYYSTRDEYSDLYM